MCMIRFHKRIREHNFYIAIFFNLQKGIIRSTLIVVQVQFCTSELFLDNSNPFIISFNIIEI